MHPDLRNPAQALTLGLGRDGAASTVKTLTGQTQVGLLLEDVVLESSQTGLVTDILLAGQSVMCSDLGMDLRAFASNSYCDGHRALGVPFNKTQFVTVKATLDANGTIAGLVNVQGLPEDVKAAGLPDVNALGERLHYAFGLGSVVVPAGGTAFITATATRDCTLGLIGFSAIAATILDLTITQIKHNGRELLAGRQDATVDEVPLIGFSHQNTDVDGRILACRVKTNDKLVIGLRNYNAGNLTVWGGIFCLPPGA